VAKAATAAEAPKKERKARNAIVACTRDGAVITVASEQQFKTAAEFDAWVLKNGEEGKTYFPIRQVSKERTVKAVAKRKLE
jgi:hypothetical protein